MIERTELDRQRFSADMERILRIEAAIYAEGTKYTTDDLVAAYKAHAARAGESALDCQAFFTQVNK